MFRGSHELTLDNKGRLAIPAKFRDALSRDFDTQRIVATLDSRDRLLFYPEGEWEKVEQQLLLLNVKGKPKFAALSKFAAAQCRNVGSG